MFHTRISDVLQGKLLQLTYDVIFDQSKKDKTSFADFVVMDFAAFFPVSAKTYFLIVCNRFTPVNGPLYEEHCSRF